MNRVVIRYWLLLLLPTLVIAMAAIRLLRYEQARIDRSFEATQTDRVQAVAQSLKQTVRSVEDSLLSSLKKLVPKTLDTALPNWVNQNPLIRNVFIWSVDDGLLYPLTDQPATQEERRFLTRYSALFDGRQPWEINGNNAIEEHSGHVTIGVLERAKNSLGLSQQTSKMSSRDSLLEIARNVPSSPTKAALPPMSIKEFRSGWLPWFADTSLYLLGWVQPLNEALVWGVEVELATLLSRLIIDFPQPDDSSTAYVLSDGSNNVLHQTGGEALEPGALPDLTVSLAPVLPHWQIAVYFGDKVARSAASRGYLLVLGLLVAVVVAAILFGGILLYRDAERNRLDAERKTTFVANVSHELKTPLTSICMYAELLKEGRVPTAKKRGTYLQGIVDESRRLARLVNNLLDFSRLEQGRKNYRLESFDLVATLQEFESAHRLRIEKENFVFTVTLPEKEVMVTTDRDVIEQVLLNLVDNAVKYAGQGGSLDIALETAPRRYQIIVSDRGPGVAAQDRDRIFNKYYRGNDSLTAEHPGSGLGLALSRQLLRDIGGDLIFAPGHEGGSSFMITFLEK